MACPTIPRKFAFEDTRHEDYRHVREGLTRRGWQMEPLPRREQASPGVHPYSGARHSSSGVHRGGATGTDFARQKSVACPDLIWSLSSRHSPALSTLGQHQATNFFETSSCLTTKAGLCRTLKSVKYGRSDLGEELALPGSFFPRCFDLSDSSQLQDFLDNFRQTAASSVVCRLRTASTTSPTSGPSRESACQPLRDKASADYSHLNCREAGGCGVDDCSENVHLWILVLAVRACRRRLLETSGWREDVAETRRDAGGAERLSDREWASLLLYSYMLRDVADGSDEAAAGVDCGSGKALFDNEGLPLSGLSLNKTTFENICLGHGNDSCDTRDEPPADVGLRGLQGLRGDSPSCSRKGIDGLASRPSSAPARQCFCNELSDERPHRLSRNHATRAREGPLHAGHGKFHSTAQLTAPGEWTLQKTKELWRGLVKIWGTSGFARSICQRTCGMRRGNHQNPDLQVQRFYNYVQLTTEAAQLCIALESRCPQWTMDGECNLWMLKPAGASKGRGVRVAWTLEQILHAQETMGGRIVQKYVETPMLLSRCSPYPQLPEDSARGRGRRGDNCRRHLQLCRRATAPGERPGLGSCARRQGLGKEGDCRAPTVTEASAAQNKKEGCPPRLGVVTIAQTLPNDEVVSLSRSPAYRMRRMGIISRESSAAKKFDIRVWVLVTSWTPLEAFVFDECYVRVCPESFTLTESKFTDPGVHITNLSVRRPQPRWRETKRLRPSTTTSACRAAIAKDGNTLGGRTTDVGNRKFPVDNKDARCHGEHDEGKEDTEGVVASQAELIRRLGEMKGGKGKGRSDGQEAEKKHISGERLWENKVFPAIEGVVRSTLLAAQSFMKPRALSFQLFGFDLLLDKDLNPWLLEVNQSPALTPSSKRQGALIASMCEGLLQLAVDRNFPIPNQAISKACTDGERSNPGGTTSFGSKDPSEELHRPARWKPILTPSQASCMKARATTANASTRSQGSAALSIQGQHLSKRGVARAERGIQEATAVNKLVTWWRSRVEECRESRCRKSRAIATICGWVHGFYPRRRRRAVLAKYAQSARAIQTIWRRASARMSASRRFMAHKVACVTIQMMWRRRKSNYRCESRRLRRKVSSGLQGWAVMVLSRRRKRAVEIIIGAVVAAMTRWRNKRDAAGHVLRELKTACDHQRQGRLVLQQFGRICLAHTRVATRNRARNVRLQNRAAATIKSVFRMAMAQSAFARAVLTLQLWCRRMQCKRERVRISTTVIQRAWRQSRQERSMWISRTPRPAVTIGALRDHAASETSDANVANTNAPAFELAPKYLATDDRGSRAPSGVGIDGPSANGTKKPAETLLLSQSCTFTCKTERCMPRRPPTSSDEEDLRISFNQLMPSATTTREDWTTPDQSADEEAPGSRCSHNTDDVGLLCDEAYRVAATEVETPCLRGKGCQRPRCSEAEVRREEEAMMEEGAYQEGLLRLEDVLPDLRNRRRKT
ncbi:unnamed protein product, partial [Scytosiphon promiscuus]